MAAKKAAPVVVYRRGPMPSLSSIYKQMWPPKPTFTEKDVPDLQGKVYIVTGGSSGVGKEVVRILYSKNATVYIAARSKERAFQTIMEAQSSFANSQGALHFLHMDFADLTTLPVAVKEFQSREKQLHVLFNNAAVQSSSNDPNSLKTAQNWEIHFGVNVLAPFLLTNLLIPTLQSTAAQTDLKEDVRVVWVCSLSVEMLGEKNRGISQDYLSYYPKLSPLERYGVSKASGYLHATEMARRFPSITSIPCNPGHLSSNLYREQPKFLQATLNCTILYPSIYGAFTELFAGVSPAVTRKDSGRWMIPWGRWGEMRSDLVGATRSRDEEGGNGHAEEFWDWCHSQIAPYMK